MQNFPIEVPDDFLDQNFFQIHCIGNIYLDIYTTLVMSRWGFVIANNVLSWITQYVPKLVYVSGEAN